MIQTDIYNLGLEDEERVAELLRERTWNEKREAASKVFISSKCLVDVWDSVHLKGFQ